MKKAQGRIPWIDEVRGFSILAMICYHIAFNLLYFLEVEAAWLGAVMESRVLSALHMTFVAVFLGISGISCHLSRRPFWRAGRVALGAAAVTAATYIVYPDQAIWFGVLHCLAVCMALFAMYARQRKRISPLLGLLLSLLLFAATVGISDGHFLTFALPRAWYRGGIYTPLGFPSPFFTSLDYVPLLPHFFLFSAGFFLGEIKIPVGRCHSRLFAFIGRHSLAVYLLHQPMVFGIFFLLKLLLR